MTIHKGVTPNDQRREQLDFLEDIFFKLIVWAMEHEAFAHFFEASMGDSIKLQRLTKFFPNSVRVFNQMLDAIIKNAEPYDREQRERAIWEER